MLNYNMEYRKGILFIRLKGSLNKTTAINLNTYLIPMILKNGIKNVVYNLKGIKEIDEIGLEAINDWNKVSDCNNGNLYICEIPSNIEIPFKNRIINHELDALKLMVI